MIGPTETAGGPVRPLVIMVPVAPGAGDLLRLDDLIAACTCYGEGPLHFVMINDGNDAAAIRLLGVRHHVDLTVQSNPRRGAGIGWLDGLLIGELAALRWIAHHLPCCGVLKLDTDALVINPYVLRLTAIFDADPSVGLVGNFDSPDGLPVPPGHIVTTRLYWRSKLLSHDRELGKLLFSGFGWRRRIRLLIKRAKENGYVLGDWCQGGAYAVSPEFLRRFARDPALARPLDFLGSDVCEDVLMAVITHALGLNLHFTGGPSRLFASKWKGLFAAPEILAASGHALIHSVKSHPGQTEDEVRAYFRTRRAHALTRLHPTPWEN